MEIASLKKYSFIKAAKRSNGLKKSILFFTPSEELKGGNIFQKLSNNYSIIQPYLDIIDADFVMQMNKNAKNIALYVDPKRLNVNGMKFVLDSHDSIKFKTFEENSKRFRDSNLDPTVEFSPG